MGGHEEVEALAGGAAGFADLDVEVFFFGFGGLEGGGVAGAGVDFRGVGDFVLGEGEQREEGDGEEKSHGDWATGKVVTP